MRIAMAAVNRHGGRHLVYIHQFQYEQVMSLLRLLRAGMTRGVASPSCSVAVCLSGELPLRIYCTSSRPTSRGGSVVVYLADAQVPSSLRSERRDTTSIFHRRFSNTIPPSFSFTSSANYRPYDRRLSVPARTRPRDPVGLRHPSVHNTTLLSISSRSSG